MRYARVCVRQVVQLVRGAVETGHAMHGKVAKEKHQVVGGRDGQNVCDRATECDERTAGRVKPGERALGGRRNVGINKE